MNGVIIYRSKYGSTRQYAGWIGEETGFPVHEAKGRDNSPVETADTVIIGCPVIAGRASLSGWMRRNLEMLEQKKIILFTTSITKPGDEKMQKSVLSSIPEALRPSVTYFPLHGRMKISDLNFFFKMMMSMAGEKDPETGKVKDVDGVARENIAELVAFVRNEAKVGEPENGAN